MISTLEIIDVLYELIKVSDLKTAVNGGLYKNNYRPLNSRTEDIVINCLPTSGTQLQTASANVNIYVPDIKFRAAGNDQCQSDFTRLKTLASLAIALLEEVSMPGYHIKIVSQDMFKEAEIEQHFINIRIEFKTFNH
jgi:hypothetical protein